MFKNQSIIFYILVVGCLIQFPVISLAIEIEQKSNISSSTTANRLFWIRFINYELLDESSKNLTKEQIEKLTELLNSKIDLFAGLPLSEDEIYQCKTGLEIEIRTFFVPPLDDMTFNLYFIQLEWKLDRFFQDPQMAIELSNQNYIHISTFFDHISTLEETGNFIHPTQNDNQIIFSDMRNRILEEIRNPFSVEFKNQIDENDINTAIEIYKDKLLQKSEELKNLTIPEFYSSPQDIEEYKMRHNRQLFESAIADALVELGKGHLLEIPEHILKVREEHWQYRLEKMKEMQEEHLRNFRDTFKINFLNSLFDRSLMGYRYMDSIVTVGIPIGIYF